MSGKKMVRDPIYGYIEIEKDYAALVDTAEFQRLRNIVQTGYQALYPSALHNRFVHSLGVYHLGCKAIDFFYENIQKDVPLDEMPAGLDRDKLRRTFLAACLLHDVGHSPFSHTGEALYDKGIDFVQALSAAVGIKLDEKGEPVGEPSACQLYKYMEKEHKGTGNPHEAMSALVGLGLCERQGLEIDRELFVRAIIGVPYDPTDGQLEMVVRNAILGMLNGQLIDVDKLDYVGRDAYVTGYSSLTLDVERLLSSYTVGRVSDTAWSAIYKKGALSVIENVIYANDLERRWIQNHPAVLYDCELVDSLLRRFDTYMREGAEGHPMTVFTRQAISAEGMSGLRRPLKLLCDDDIVAYMKNEDESEIARQYFDRGRRLKPLWKTEAEFEYLANKNLTSEIQGLLVKDLEGIREYIRTRGALFINEELIKELNAYIEKAEAQAKTIKQQLEQLLQAENAGGAADRESAPETDGPTDDPALEEEESELPAASYRRIREICQIFGDFAAKYELRFNFAFVLAGKFQTGYRKLAIDKIQIQLGSGIVPLKKLMSLRAKEVNQDSSDDLFYVYTDADNLTGGTDLGAYFMDFLRCHYARPEAK